MHIQRSDRLSNFNNIDRLLIALSCVYAASNLINSFVTYLGWSVNAAEASWSPARRLSGCLSLGHRPVLAASTARRAASPPFRPRQSTVGDIGRIGGVRGRAGATIQ